MTVAEYSYYLTMLLPQDMDLLPVVCGDHVACVYSLRRA